MEFQNDYILFWRYNLHIFDFVRAPTTTTSINQGKIPGLFHVSCRAFARSLYTGKIPLYFPHKHALSSSTSFWQKTALFVIKSINNNLNTKTVAFHSNNFEQTSLSITLGRWQTRIQWYFQVPIKKKLRFSQGIPGLKRKIPKFKHKEFLVAYEPCFLKSKRVIKRVKNWTFPHTCAVIFAGTATNCG